METGFPFGQDQRGIPIQGRDPLSGGGRGKLHFKEDPPHHWGGVGEGSPLQEEEEGSSISRRIPHIIGVGWEKDPLKKGSVIDQFWTLDKAIQDSTSLKNSL